MKYLILSIVLSVMFETVNAQNNEPSKKHFCEWLGNAANTIAINRDKGIEEFDLIGKYLEQNSSYGEQSVVIPLIDRVYGIEKTLNPDEVAYAERASCEIAGLY